MCQADEIALFNSLTSYALMCGNRKLIYELTDAILSELKKEQICELNDMTPLPKKDHANWELAPGFKPF